MKKVLFVLCLLSATAAFAQYSVGGGSRSNQPSTYDFSSHPIQAAYAAMSQERSILGANNFSTAHGERPVSDFPQAEAPSLGAIARELKKQHAELKKSRIVWVNQ